jgi:hypothetical protein
MAATEKVFTNRTTNGQSTAYDWPGGVGTFVCEGTWNSATVKMQMSPDGGTTWVDVGDDVTFTDDGVGNFELGGDSNFKIRADLSSAGNSTSIDCWMTVRHPYGGLGTVG